MKQLSTSPSLHRYDGSHQTGATMRTTTTSMLVLVVLVFVSLLHPSDSSANTATTSTTTSNDRPTKETHFTAEDEAFATAFVKRSKAHFEQSFAEKCHKYTFYHRYVDLHRKLPNRYLLFAYEDGSKAVGGIGDRLAGMISAFAYAIRSNRTLLIEGGPAFEQYFRPYSADMHIEGKPVNFTNWADWSWSKWEYMKGIQQMKCVNPRQEVCALDRLDETSLKDRKAVKYRGNRVYLCRWLTMSMLTDIRGELGRSLGVNASSDLYEAAGCMLRMTMHPTDKLWQDVTIMIKRLHYKYRHHVEQHLTTSSLPKKTKTAVKKLVGMHFRCGDVNYADSYHANKIKETKQVLNITSRCMAVSGQKWKGIPFDDDISPESPLDLAHCSSRILHSYPQLTDSEENIVYIASDNDYSAHQMMSTLISKGVTVLRPHETCHVDLNHGVDCGLLSLQQWFVFALSNDVILQSFITNEKSITADKEDVTSVYQAPYSKESFPASGFSRFAAIYGLSQIHYGSQCQHRINMTTLSHYSHGNWFCNPSKFF